MSKSGDKVLCQRLHKYFIIISPPVRFYQIILLPDPHFPYFTNSLYSMLHSVSATATLSVLLCLTLSISAQPTLIIYPPTDALSPSSDYLVKVRAPGQPWKEVPVYQVKVADGSAGTFRTKESSMAYFDFSGKVEIAVTCKKRQPRSMRIRPLSYNIPAQRKGKTLHFTLDQPRNISIEPDGDIFHNLQLFAGSPETAVPDKADTNTIYYGPGVHTIGTLHVPGGKHVYLAGGAVVEGQFLIDQQENIHISGRGILYQPPGNSIQYDKGRRDAIRIDFSKDISVDGIIVIPNTYTVLIGNSRHVQLSNLKSISAGGNNDGVDVFCSGDVLMEGLFLRNSDDCIAIYGHRWQYYGNVDNITVRNSMLWADVAHPILAGTHGDPGHPDTLEDLHFENIDILDQQENQVDYQGCMSLNAGDSNLIRNVRFENIRVEDFRKGQLVNLRIMYNKKYNTAPGKGIENVLFKNISYTGSHATMSIIAGYDEACSIRNITFQGLTINGRLITDHMPGKPGWYKTSDMAGFFVGEHVEGLQFE